MGQDGQDRTQRCCPEKSPPLCPWTVAVRREPNVVFNIIGPLRLSQAALWGWPLALEPGEPGLEARSATPQATL